MAASLKVALMTIKENLQSHGLAIRNTAVIPPDMIMSEAFRSLKKITTDVLIRFLQKRHYSKSGKGKNAKVTYDNDGLIFTYTEADCFKISRASFRRAIQELYEKGFISIMHQGGSFGNGRDWSTYRLIDDWKLYGTPQFKPRAKVPGASFNDCLENYNEKRRKQKSTVTHDDGTLSSMTTEKAKTA
jgi:hypothetical protein